MKEKEGRSKAQTNIDTDRHSIKERTKGGKEGRMKKRNKEKENESTDRPTETDRSMIKETRQNHPPNHNHRTGSWTD